jgi:hypothetical protein|tara:strand:+ start:1539 stop:1892 length:354 start_codon:yes stop_codon:yes gene_type:complete
MKIKKYKKGGKNKKGKKRNTINYDIGPAYSATSKSRSVADKKYHHIASGSGLDSKLYQNPDGSYTRKSVDSSPAEYKKGGKMKYKKGGKFPDLNKDGKITKADILMGRGVGMKKKKK